MVDQISNQKRIDGFLSDVSIFCWDSVAKNNSNIVRKLTTVSFECAVEILLNGIKVNPDDLSATAEKREGMNIAARCPTTRLAASRRGKDWYDQRISPFAETASGLCRWRLPSRKRSYIGWLPAHGSPIQLGPLLVRNRHENRRRS